jgi:hypothetical protein
MAKSKSSSKSTARVLLASLLLGGLASASVSAAQPDDWRNATTGGALRPGIYGRIVVKGKAPPVIYDQPLVATGAPALHVDPVYLYVPPGQVRKWKQNCAKWSACDKPVLFVRVDDSPSRWGHWRVLREQLALHGND